MILFPNDFFMNDVLFYAYVSFCVYKCVYMLVFVK